MASNTDRPFAHDTFRLRAVFVPDEDKDNASRTDIAGAIGHDSVKIPAVFVAEGETAPGYPYSKICRGEFREDEEEDSPEKRRYTFWPTASEQPETEQQETEQPETEQQDREAVPTLPRTRYRFGAALSGDSLPLPPNPTAAARQEDAVRAGLAMLRAVGNPSGVWRRGGGGAPLPVAAQAESRAGAANASSPGGGSDPTQAKRDDLRSPDGGVPVKLPDAETVQDRPTAPAPVSPVADLSAVATTGRAVGATLRQMLEAPATAEGADS